MVFGNLIPRPFTVDTFRGSASLMGQLYFSGGRSELCLPGALPDLPDLPPPCLHTAINQRLEVEIGLGARLVFGMLLAIPFVLPL